MSDEPVRPPLRGAAEAPGGPPGAGGPPEVVTLGDGCFLVVEGSRRRLAYGAVDGNVTWVFLDGATHVVEAPEARARTARLDHEAALSAPMPATVLRVDVEPGQQVRRGDTVLVLEAMKMELPLKTPRDGVVTAVRCRPGELVQPGVPLLDLE